MNLKYLANIDLMYVYLETNVPNTQTRTKLDQVFKFVAKADKNRVIGYEIENASKNLKHFLSIFDLNRKQKLAVCLYFIREKHGKTQKQFADLLEVSESKYKSLEKGEHNISFDTLDVIFESFKREPLLDCVFAKAS
jgi:DNA-binding XRE family transcriptional regulator/uncharacterized protein YuzE